jgi:hypothetical protein
VLRLLAASEAAMVRGAGERHFVAQPRARRVRYIGAVDGEGWQAKGGVEHVG